MIIQDVDSLVCDLPALEELSVNLQNRYGLQLRDNFNVEEVKHFVDYVGRRLLQYQYTFFYEHLLELPKEAFEVRHEKLTKYQNKINNTVDDFHRFILRVQAPKIKNEFKKENQGPDSLENVDWNFAVSFLNIFDLSNFGYINTEDLKFTNPQASFFGRSVAALIVQDYINFHHRDVVKRNFNLIRLDKPEYAKSATDVIQKQRDLCLTRQETIDWLKAIKCRKTGKDLTILLDKDFDLVSA